MKVKKLITLIEILAMTGLVSVGFSSWLIIESNPAIIEGKVNVEEVFDNNDYITIKNMSFSDYYFNNGQGGFYPDYTYTNDLTKLTSTGILEFDIIIDLNKYRTELKTSPSSVELDIVLGYSVQHNGQIIGNFMDIISRSLSKNASDVSNQGDFNSTFTYLYDGVSPDSSMDIQIISSGEVSYSNSTPAPNINRKIKFLNISSVNNISISAEYIFKLDNGFSAQDNASLNEGGVPFKLSAILENA